MGKLALNFICKNESHIINKMLESCKEITDLIVATDTGSTDGTQEIIKDLSEFPGWDEGLIFLPEPIVQREKAGGKVTRLINKTTIGCFM